MVREAFRTLQRRSRGTRGARLVAILWTMSLKYRVVQRGSHVVVRVDGEPTLAEFIEFIRSVGAESQSWPSQRALIDLRSVRTLRTFTEHYAIGEEVARTLAHMERLASVVPADRLTRASEKMARQGGIDLTVFTSEGEAIEWLTRP